MMIQVYPSDFGGIEPTRRAPKRMRRMSKRKVKRYLAKRLEQAWAAGKPLDPNADVPQTPGGTF